MATSVTYLSFESGSHLFYLSHLCFFKRCQGCHVISVLHSLSEEEDEIWCCCKMNIININPSVTIIFMTWFFPLVSRPCWFLFVFSTCRRLAEQWLLLTSSSKVMDTCRRRSELQRLRKVRRRQTATTNWCNTKFCARLPISTKCSSSLDVALSDRYVPLPVVWFSPTSTTSLVSGGQMLEEGH